MKLLSTAAFVIASTNVAMADVDRLPNPQVTTITVALEQGLSNPEKNVDRLSPARLVSVHLAFATHEPEISVDRLTAANWTTIKSAYRSHEDRKLLSLASIAD